MNDGIIGARQNEWICRYITHNASPQSIWCWLTENDMHLETDTLQKYDKTNIMPLPFIQSYNQQSSVKSALLDSVP